MLDSARTYALTLPVTLAAAGGGSGGFGGGGGGGGGGSGGGFSGGSGGGVSLLGFLVIAVIVLFVLVSSWIGARVARRKLLQRAKRVATAAAEAAEDDPDFAADAVTTKAGDLFKEIQAAWTAVDRGKLSRLVGPDLAREWVRRLDDFEKKGWHNVVKVLADPKVHYVGLANREDDEDDRVIVKIEASLYDFVETKSGQVLKANNSSSASRMLKEFWTLGKQGESWILLSIEQEAEGRHQLDAELVTTPWDDTGRLRDDSLLEAAVAEKVMPGFEVADVADLDFDGDARAAALDLSLADGRFAPDILEAAARRAVAGWTEAIDGEDSQLDGIASPEAKQQLLYPGDPSGRTRLVVRGPKIRRVHIAVLDAAARPPTMTLDVDVTGTRYVQDRDTTTIVSGSDSREIDFTERWVMALDGPDAQPWRIAGVANPAAR